MSFRGLFRGWAGLRWVLGYGCMGVFFGFGLVGGLFLWSILLVDLLPLVGWVIWFLLLGVTVVLRVQTVLGSCGRLQVASCKRCVVPCTVFPRLLPGRLVGMNGAQSSSSSASQRAGVVHLAALFRWIDTT